LDADEEVVEATVLKVVLDACAPDPADPAVHHDELAMVDVPEPAHVPPGRATPTQCSGGNAKPGRTHDANLDSRSREAIVEVLRAPLRVRPLPVHDEPDGDALSGLGDQRVRKPVTDEARPEAELVDVHRGRGCRDVGEHPWVERGALDEDLHRGRRALLEPEHEGLGARRD
jgi:hypothetical protein